MAEQNKMLLSAETRVGLEFTGKLIVQYCDKIFMFIFTYSKIIHRSCEARVHFAWSHNLSGKVIWAAAAARQSE